MFNKNRQMKIKNSDNDYKSKQLKKITCFVTNFTSLRSVKIRFFNCNALTPRNCGWSHTFYMGMRNFDIYFALYAIIQVGLLDFLWGYAKDRVYSDKPAILEGLKNQYSLRYGSQYMSKLLCVEVIYMMQSFAHNVNV